MSDTNERSAASTGDAWSRDKPTAEGLYLYRDSRGQCLMKVARDMDLQQGMPDELYAFPQSAGRAKSMGFDAVARTDGEWINVTRIFGDGSPSQQSHGAAPPAPAGK